MSAKAYEHKLGYQPVPDPDFALDVEEGIAARYQPFNEEALRRSNVFR